MDPKKKRKLEKLRRWRIRKQVVGTQACPRMSVRFTNTNIYVQFIDDASGRTLASASTVAKSVRQQERLGANVAGATRLGALAAQAAKDQGISRVVFDRSGASFHGKVKALADAAREGGLKF